MGRARKDQRENIRKRRLAKRKKREKGGNDSSDNYKIDGNNLTRLFKESLESSSSLSVSTEKTKNSPHENRNLVGNLPEPTTSDKERSQTNDTKPQKVDKIERMRLKKQEQKARRRQKKAAKALMETNMKNHT